MSEYFPLVKGAMREYALSNAEGSGHCVIDVLEVATSKGVTKAKCRKTLNWNGEPAKVTEFEAAVDEKEARGADGTEFEFPVKSGTEWIRPPRRYFIEVLDGVIQTPAGKFKDCLRVAYKIAEGDGGSGERHYAPGVGLVKIVENDEANPYTFELIALR